MEVLDELRACREDGLVQLLDPPFDQSDVDPGYIKSEVPGVRENGSQYTHSAIWAAMAFAALGDSRGAWELTTTINPANLHIARGGSAKLLRRISQKFRSPHAICGLGACAVELADAEGYPIRV